MPFLVGTYNKGRIENEVFHRRSHDILLGFFFYYLVGRCHVDVVATHTGVHMLKDNSVTAGMLAYINRYATIKTDRRRAYHEKVCLARAFQRYHIPFGSFPAWEKSQEFHAVKAAEYPLYTLSM